MMHSLLDADMDIDRRGLLERNDISDMLLSMPKRLASGKYVTAFLFRITVAPLFIYPILLFPARSHLLDRRQPRLGLRGLVRLEHLLLPEMEGPVHLAASVSPAE